MVEHLLQDLHRRGLHAMHIKLGIHRYSSADVRVLNSSFGMGKKTYYMRSKHLSTALLTYTGCAGSRRVNSNVRESCLPTFPEPLSMNVTRLRPLSALSPMGANC